MLGVGGTSYYPTVSPPPPPYAYIQRVFTVPFDTTYLGVSLIKPNHSLIRVIS